MNKNLRELCDEIIQGASQPDAGCVHLSAEMARLLAEGYKRLDVENMKLRGQLLEHLPEISQSTRADWEKERGIT